MANSRKKKKVTWVRPPIDLTDPDLTDEEIDKAVEDMAKSMVEKLFGKQDWDAVNKELEKMDKEGK